MIELHNDQLVARFPEVHPDATVRIEFQRTLRIPDDDRDYPLPPGLGRFPLCHVDDFGGNVPPAWIEHGGIMLPMYQAEALWVNFGGRYPFAVKVATGKIDAVTGKTVTNGLHRDPQDYLVVPEQPWLDGYCVKKGIIRQFVAMPLGSGYSAEEQLTGEAEYGGLQLIVYPMKREVYERMRKMQEPHALEFGSLILRASVAEYSIDMGLAPGGRMRQEIFEDRYGLEDWDRTHTHRCFVHIANSLVWRQITGSNPPTVPPTAQEYARADLPWFDYYDDRLEAVEGSRTLDGLKTVTQLGNEKGDVPLPENASVTPTPVVQLRKGLEKDQVREGVF